MEVLNSYIWRRFAASLPRFLLVTAQFFNVSFNSSLGGELEKFSASEQLHVVFEGLNLVLLVVECSMSQHLADRQVLVH